MADDDIQRFAYDNAVFHNIVQHYDDTARGNHDDIDFDAATIDDLDGTEYDNNGNPVKPIGTIGAVLIDFGGILSDICDAIEQFGSFEDIPDDYEFDPFASDEDDGDDPPCQFIFLLDFVRRPPNCSRNNPYRAPGDDDDYPGSPAA